jgi:hypothetical protein
VAESLEAFVGLHILFIEDLKGYCAKLFAGSAYVSQAETAVSHKSYRRNTSNNSTALLDNIRDPEYIVLIIARQGGYKGLFAGIRAVCLAFKDADKHSGYTFSFIRDADNNMRRAKININMINCHTQNALCLLRMI